MIDSMSHEQAQESMNQQGMNQQQAAAMLRAAQQQSQQGGAPTGGYMGGGMSSNQMAAMFQQQSQPQQGNASDQQGNYDIGNEIKRIQQLHQLGNAAGAPGNALLMTGAGNRGNDPSMLLQSMLDQQQKVQQQQQQPRFDNPLANNLGGPNPLFQPGFLQDARFLMAQNQFNAAQLQARQPEIPLPSPHSLFHRDGSRRMRGGVIEPFPEKLHRLLTEVEAAGRSDVISFVANGRAFAIHKPDKFFKEIVPLYFRQSRLSSFKRQLNLYGFELINSGPARGGYFHELFVKDQPELCRRMRRVAVKVGSKDSKDASKVPGDDKEDASRSHLKEELGA